MGGEGRGNGNDGGDTGVSEFKIRVWEYSDGEREKKID